MRAAGTLPAPPDTASALPRLLGHAVLAGLAGLLVWEPFARLVAPLWLGHPLEPTALIELSLGISGVAAHALHYVTGLLFFPLGYLLAVRPIAARVAPGLPWPVLGLAHGAALWVFALFVMAHLVGGLPPFLGFEPVAWASLVGHLGLGLGIAAAAERLARRAG